MNKFKIRIIIFLIILICIISNLIATAEIIEKKLDIKLLFDLEDIYIEGKIEDFPNKLGFIRIYKPDKYVENINEDNVKESILFQDQLKIDKDGGFEISFGYDTISEGICHVEVGLIGVIPKYTTTYNTLNISELKSSIENLNDKKSKISDTELKNLIEDICKKNKIKDELFENTAKKYQSAFYTAFSKTTKTTSLKHLISQLRNTSLMIISNNISDKDEFLSFLETHKKELNIENSTYYNTLLKLETETKNSVLTVLMANDIELFENFNSEFSKTIILTSLEKVKGWENIKDILVDNQKILSLDFAKCNSLNTPQNVYVRMLGKSYVALGDIEIAFDESVKNVAEEERYNNSSQGGSGGNGGGSNGGGSVSYITPTKKPEIPKDELFVDLDGYDWAKKSIELLCKKGVVNGKGNGKFAPYDNITRAEFSKMIVLAFDLSNNLTSSNFTDVAKDDWAYEYVSVLSEYGIVKGKTENFFGKEQFITREEMAVIAHRTLEYISKDYVIENSKISFSDMNDISDYAKESVSFMQAKGIINGTSENIFSPKLNSTRAQATVIIDRLLKFTMN